MHTRDAEGAGASCSCTLGAIQARMLPPGTSRRTVMPRSRGRQRAARPRSKLQAVTVQACDPRSHPGGRKRQRGSAPARRAPGGSGAGAPRGSAPAARRRRPARRPRPAPPARAPTARRATAPRAPAPRGGRDWGPHRRARSASRAWSDVAARPPLGCVVCSVAESTEWPLLTASHLQPRPTHPGSHKPGANGRQRIASGGYMRKEAVGALDKPAACGGRGSVRPLILLSAQDSAQGNLRGLACLLSRRRRASARQRRTACRLSSWRPCAGVYTNQSHAKQHPSIWGCGYKRPSPCTPHRIARPHNSLRTSRLHIESHARPLVAPSSPDRTRGRTLSLGSQGACTNSRCHACSSRFTSTYALRARQPSGCCTRGRCLLTYVRISTSAAVAPCWFKHQAPCER